MVLLVGLDALLHLALTHINNVVQALIAGPALLAPSQAPKLRGQEIVHNFSNTLTPQQLVVGY